MLRQKIRVMEQRMEVLEATLARLQQEQARQAQERQQTGGDQGRSGTATATNTAPTSTDRTKSAKSGEKAGSTQSRQVTTEVQTGDQPADKTTTVTAATEDVTAAQETFIFRDQSPTLKKGQGEISTEFNYLRSSAFIQSDRVFNGATTLRYGLMTGLEGAIAVPYYRSVRTTQLLPGQEYVGVAQGVGSISGALSYSLINQTPDWPGVAVSASGFTPGQVSPYDFTQFQTGHSPVDILRSVQNSGHWGLGANVVAYKTVDPLVIFAGVGVQYLFPRTFGAYYVQPAMKYTGNAGFSFALSDKTTLGVEVRGFYQPNLKVNGTVAPQSFQEQYLARVALIQRIFDQTWIEPSVMIGLTKESPDLGLGAAVRRRF